MTRDLTSKTIDGITDLVIWAPIKEGFIDAYENVTYETRLRLVAEALHKVRRSAREHELITPFADTAERILTLLNFRIGIVDRDLYQFETPEGKTPVIKPRRYMYLTATFDGPWEPYIRLIWNPLGPFLDLLLCNCQDYVVAADSSFEEYADWVRQHQLDSAIFYSTTGLTVKDQLYLSKLERYQRELDPATGDEKIARMISDDPEKLAEAVRKNPDQQNQREYNRLALEALTVLYRLADYYPPDRIIPGANIPDLGKVHTEGRYLLRVAQDLLHGWKPKILPLPIQEAYSEPLGWFNKQCPKSLMVKTTDPVFDPTEIQKGLLTSYDTDENPSTHGALLLLQINDLEKVRKFIKLFPVSWEKTSPEAEDPGLGIFHRIFRNIAFTYHGLRRMGVSDDELMKFPKEFREGMESRAPMMGDTGENHPRRWELPARNWPHADPDIISKRPPVELSEVDFVIQLRTSTIGLENADTFQSFSESAMDAYRDLLEKNITFSWGDDNIEERQFFAKENISHPHPFDFLIALIGYSGPLFGFSLLAVESMNRPNSINRTDDKLSSFEDARPTVDHFGFRDGLSQPIITDDTHNKDQIKLGDLFYGYANSRGDFAPPKDSNIRSKLLFNGSFLVIRKMQQNVKAFEDFLDRNESPSDPKKKIKREELAARLVGRYRDGIPLIKPANGNDFDYVNDDKGTQCPFASHIRRSNPRVEFQDRKPPRILRRGMSYGHSIKTHPDENRGIVFMAYNASIAEQFEVIQGWINGGNSTNISSSQNDPLIGFGKDRTFRFVMGGKVKRVQIDVPFVKLEWGTYLFVPSQTALGTICNPPQRIPNQFQKNPRGRNLIQTIQALPPEVQRLEWKTLLEDFLTKDPTERAATPAVWEEIIDEGGVLRISSGVAFVPPPAAGQEAEIDPQTGAAKTETHPPVVLVADKELIMEVLKDASTYSVSKQKENAESSFGSIYVAQDPDSTYYKEAKETNEILFKIGEEQAFQDAYNSATEVLSKKKNDAQALGANWIKLELRRQFLMPTLGNLCTKWFGIPDDEHFIDHGWGWDEYDKRKPHCPGDFLAPSRRAFYPRPTAPIKDYGVKHGIEIKKAGRKFVDECRATGKIDGTIANEMFAKISDNDLLARNLIGIMVGALPPIDGNLRGILFEWLKEKTLWRHQGALHRATGGNNADFHAANSTLREAIQTAMSKRPAPDLIFRTATKQANLGKGSTKVIIEKGDTVILGLVSATQQHLAAHGKPDISTVFGGRRSGASQSDGGPIHACPAYKMAMGSMLGILAALLDSGRIHALPSSLIVEISDW